MPKTHVGEIFVKYMGHDIQYVYIYIYKYLNPTVSYTYPEDPFSKWPHTGV